MATFEKARIKQIKRLNSDPQRPRPADTLAPTMRILARLSSPPPGAPRPPVGKAARRVGAAALCAAAVGLGLLGLRASDVATLASAVPAVSALPFDALRGEIDAGNHDWRLYTITMDTELGGLVGKVLTTSGTYADATWGSNMEHWYLMPDALGAPASKLFFKVGADQSGSPSKSFTPPSGATHLQNSRTPVWSAKLTADPLSGGALYLGQADINGSTTSVVPCWFRIFNDGTRAWYVDASTLTKAPLSITPRGGFTRQASGAVTGSFYYVRD